MKITCPNCQTKLKMDDAKIPEQGIKAKCPNCGQMIIAQRPAPEEVVSEMQFETDGQYFDQPSEMAPPPPPPPPYSSASQGGPPPGPDPSKILIDNIPDRLVLSIVITIVCCMPLGVAAIIYSARTKSFKAAGDYERARSASRTAGILNLIAVIIGVLVFVGSIVLSIAIPQFASMRQKGYDAVAKSALGNLKTAQEAYYLDNDTYGQKLSDLEMWFAPEDDVIVEILAADGDSWSAWARHYESGDRFVYSSSEGGLRGPE